MDASKRLENSSVESSAEPVWFAESKRLRFRLLSPEDRKLYCDLYTNAAVMQYICQPLSRLRAGRSFEKALDDLRATRLRKMSAVVERSTSGCIGIASLRAVDASSRHAELGLMLAPHAWGRGFAVESLLALIDDAFVTNGLDAIYVHTAPSHALIERIVVVCGFTSVSGPIDRLKGKAWLIERHERLKGR